MTADRTALSRHWVVARVATGLAALAVSFGFSFTALAGEDLPEGAIFCNGLAATIEGTSAAETLQGTRGNDVIVGRGGRDTVNGGRGHDTICGADDQLSTLTGNLLNGGPGFDTLIGDGGPDTIHGGGDIDIIYSTAFNTPSDGGERFPEMDEGAEVRNILAGDSGEDFIFSGTGADQLIGNEGPDHLHGGAADDRLNAGADSEADRDEAFGDGGDDVILGGGGSDRGLGGLVGGPGQDDLFGGPGIDFLGGVEGNDELQGGGQRDLLHGGEDHDRLFGQAGDDDLFGEEGPDDHFGGPQDDRCFGEAADGDTFNSCENKKRKKRRAKIHVVTIRHFVDGVNHACLTAPALFPQRLKITIERFDFVKWINRTGEGAFVGVVGPDMNVSSPLIANGSSFRVRFPRLGAFIGATACSSTALGRHGEAASTDITVVAR